MPQTKTQKRHRMLKELVEARDVIEAFRKSGRKSSKTLEVSYNCPLCDYSRTFTHEVWVGGRNEDARAHWTADMVIHVQSHYVDQWFEQMSDLVKELNGLHAYIGKLKAQRDDYKGRIERVIEAMRKGPA